MQKGAQVPSFIYRGDNYPGEAGIAPQRVVTDQEPRISGALRPGNGNSPLWSIPEIHSVFFCALASLREIGVSLRLWYPGTKTFAPLRTLFFTL